MSTTRNSVGERDWQSMDIVDEQASPETPIFLSKFPLAFIRRVARAPSSVTAALSAGVLVCFLWILAPPGFFRGLAHHPGPPPPPKWNWPPFLAEQSSKPKPSGVNWDARAEDVKKAFLHAYHGYEQYAMPADELQPLTNGRINK